MMTWDPSEEDEDTWGAEAWVPPGPPWEWPQPKPPSEYHLFRREADVPTNWVDVASDYRHLLERLITSRMTPAAFEAACRELARRALHGA